MSRLPRAFFEPAPVPEEGVPPRGCAWFDSSHELMRGLVVVEVPVVWVLPAPPIDQRLNA